MRNLKDEELTIFLVAPYRNEIRAIRIWIQTADTDAKSKTLTG